MQRKILPRFTKINAKIVFYIDDTLHALYINNLNIVSYNYYVWPMTGTITITLLPGKNMIDFQMRNYNGPGQLCFYVTHATTNALLCQSDANVKCRLLNYQ